MAASHFAFAAATGPAQAGLAPRSASRYITRSIAAWLASLAVLVPAAGQAQVLEAGPEIVQSTQRWLEEAVGKVQPLSGTSLRMEVTVGALDERLRLAPCSRVEPYIPPGARLWGKSRLGLRCIDGPTRWNVFLPITVKAFGPAWMVSGSVASGAVLAATDAVEGEVDWAAENTAVLADPAAWIGQVSSRPLSPGQTLRQGMVKPPQIFQAGAQVRIVAQGAGFSVASDGQALGAGAVGQPVKVRMENGRIVAGVVMDDRSVRIGL